MERLFTRSFVYAIGLLIALVFSFAICVSSVFADTERAYISPSNANLDASGTGWTYEGETHTLTLYGYKGEDAVVYADDVNIVLRSRNTPQSGIKVYGNLTLSGSGTLDLSSDQAQSGIGIYCSGNLTINSGNYIIERRSYGIRADGDILFRGTADATFTVCEYAMKSDGNITVDTSKDVIVKGINYGANASFHAGKNVTISSSGKVETGTYQGQFGDGPGIVGKSVIFDGCQNVYLTSTNYGISGSNVIFNNAKVDLAGYHPIAISGSVDITDSEVDIYAGYSAITTTTAAEHGFAVSGNSKVTLSAGNKQQIIYPASICNIIDLEGGYVKVGSANTVIGLYLLGDHSFLLNKEKYNIATGDDGAVSIGLKTTDQNSGASATFAYAESEDRLAPTITTSTLASGFVDEVYQGTIQATGVEPLTWAVTEGEFPDGLTLGSSTGKITGTPEQAGTFSFEVTVTNGAGNASKELQMVICHPKNPLPTASFVANGENGGTLKHVSNKMKYSVDGGGTWNSISGQSIEIDGVTPETGIQVYQPADSTSSDSPIQTISVTKAAEPTTCTATDCTTSDNNDGTISGITTDMEYKTENDNMWTSGTGDVLTGLSPDTYLVRNKAYETTLASNAIRVVVKEHVHNYGSWITTRESSCTEKGSKERTCSCGDKETTEIPLKSHEAVDIPAVPETCTETGLSKGTKCSVCGEILTAPKTTPAKGHSWNEPTYSWGANNASVTASRTCKNDTSHKQTETVKTTIKVTRAATYTAEGQTTYTAVFSNSAFKPQSKTVTDIPMLVMTVQQPIVDLPVVRIAKPKAGKKSMTVKWKKPKKKVLKKLQGYEIQYSKDGFKTIAGTKYAGKGKKSVKIKGLQPKTKYQVRIRAYKNAADGKHVSVWRIKSVKVK